MTECVITESPPPTEGEGWGEEAFFPGRPAALFASGRRAVSGLRRLASAIGTVETRFPCSKSTTAVRHGLTRGFVGRTVQNCEVGEVNREIAESREWPVMDRGACYTETLSNAWCWQERTNGIESIGFVADRKTHMIWKRNPSAGLSGNRLNRS